MVQVIKSVLFFDYDSLYRSLQDRAPAAAEQLAPRAGAWLEAIESGRLITPSPGDAVRRRILMKRCYADPQLLGRNRSWLSGNGIQVIDCPPVTGHERNSAEVLMVLDVVDGLQHATGFDEFIILTAHADLTPLLFRLRAHNRDSVIYVSEQTADSYKALADATIAEAGLIEVLSARRPGILGPRAEPAPTLPADPPQAERPAPQAERAAPQAERAAPRAERAERAPATEPDRSEPAEPARADRGGIDREELSSLVRRIHNSTKVPLFSPRLYSELFTVLAQEVAENGYRFQATAENVATRLADAGRNATRRQVGFVVKGLALKGHVFSQDDSAEKLADEFRQQVLYLARSAGLELSDREQALIGAWVSSRASGPAEAVIPAPAPPPVEPEPPPPPPQAAPPRSVAAAAPKAPPPARTPSRGRAQLRPVEPAPPPEPQPEPEPPAEEDIDMEAHAEPAAPPPPPIARPAPRRPAAEDKRPAARAKPAAEPEKADMESSILAAIAEAVDVLVEDRSTDRPRNDRRKQEPAATDAPPPGQDDGGDIGDEIQRILASYSQNRPGGRQ